MDLLVAVVVSLLMPPLAWLAEGPVRIAVAAAFLLFLPGYALVAVFYPLKRNLELVERIGLSFAASVAVVSLIGIALNYSSWGIRLTPLMLSVLAFTLCMCGVAVARRSKVAPADRYSVPFSMPLVDWRSMGWEDRALTGALIASLVFATGAVAFAIGSPREGPKSTGFYIIGPGGMATGYPEVVVQGEPAEITLGIVNHEGGTLSYRVEGWLDGDPEGLAVYVAGPDVAVVSPSTFVLEELADEASWESVVELTPLLPGDQLKAELLLYSSRPRVDVFARTRMGEDGYILLQIDEARGATKLTVSPPDGARHDCRIQAWQDGALVSEDSVAIEAGAERTVEFSFPPGETAFRVYDGGTLVLDDRGEDLSLHLWIDVPEGGEA